MHDFIENIINDNFNVSIINRIEVLGHASSTDDIIDFMSLATTHQLTENIANQTIYLRKHRKVKLPDAIIASTAIILKSTLLSRNAKNFQNIPGLVFINPYDI